MIVAVALALAGSAVGIDGAVDVPDPRRVVVLGSSLTEAAWAVGASERVVGVDSSSRYPAEATARPQVGYYRQLSAEGVLALRPDLVLALDEAGPERTLTQLRAAGVPVLRLDGAPTVEAARARIRAVAAVLEVEDTGELVVRQLEADLADLRRPDVAPTVAFVFGRGAGALTLAGQDTAADAMIALSGGRNAVQGVRGYLPLTPEALVAAAPDVVLTTVSIVEALGGEAAVLAVPAVAATPAGRAGRLVVVDDLLLLGFGPRLGQGARALAEALR